MKLILSDNQTTFDVDSSNIRFSAKEEDSLNQSRIEITFNKNVQFESITALDVRLFESIKLSNGEFTKIFEGYAFNNLNEYLSDNGTRLTLILTK